MPTALTTFRVTVSDPNVGDDLYVRWVADYPPFGPNTRALGSPIPVPALPGGMPLHESVPIDIGCQLLVTSIDVHQIVVFVADRKFDLTATTQLTKLEDDTGLVQAGSWYFTLKGCQQQ